MIDFSLGPFVLNAPPTNGVLNGLAGHGAFLVDRSTGDLYRNTGTISATVWAKLGDVQMGSGANEGDVPTWDGSKYVPQAPSGTGAASELIGLNGAVVQALDGVVHAETGGGAALDMSVVTIILNNDTVQLTVFDTGIALQVDSGGLLLWGLPTSDPAVAGAVWNDAGTLKISAG